MKKTERERRVKHGMKSSINNASSPGKMEFPHPFWDFADNEMREKAIKMVMGKARK